MDQHIGHFGQRKAQLLSLPDQPHKRRRIAVECAIAIGAADRADQPAPLVKPQRVAADAGPGGKFADMHLTP
jgi:hypothetical protein